MAVRRTELQDGSGCLSVQGLAKNDEVFDELINSGWHWIVFSEGAETAWPSLPSFLQYAYNSGNSLYTVKGEMESAMEIATMAKSAPVPVDYESIVQHVRKSQPACSSYLGKLAEFCQLYSIEGCNTIAELDGFSKRWGDSRMLGEEYVTVVVETHFFGGAPHRKIRKCLMATNLVSNEVVDGIARLVVKSDIAKITKMHEQCKHVEESITKCDTLVAKLIEDNTLRADKRG